MPANIEEIIEWPELADVKTELEDPKYANRKHGSRATKAKGCSGPLCRRAERLRSRNRNASRAADAGRDYSPGSRLYDRDALLDAVVEWHEADLNRRRKEAREALKQAG